MDVVHNYHIGDQVEITLKSNPERTSSGIIAHIFPQSGKDRTLVLLRNGDVGWINYAINSDDIRKKRIMQEGQHTENKELFYGNVMRNDVIPKAVQAFLNSEGGYLYIGVRDTGSLEERLVGLDRDFQQITGYKDMTIDKLQDKLKGIIMSALDKRLTSDVSLGSLVEINFVDINKICIAEITVQKSTKPWFFQNLSRSGKPFEFELFLNKEPKGKRTLDDFYIRQGERKVMLSTHKEFYKYAVNHFESINNEH